MVVEAFHLLVACHIVTGAIGLVAFWIPVLSQKGGGRHILFGRIFTICMLLTGTIAVGISSSTLLAPLATHPAISDTNLIESIFGWMMLYLAILTVNLAWFGWLAAINKRDHQKNWEWRNLLLQILVLVTAANCLVRGLMIQQVLMIGISFVGFATVATNMWFLLKSNPGPMDWLLEHIKSLVGAGISVYTAFLAFGAVRYMPEAALSPILWAIPLVTGVTIIVYQQRKVKRRSNRNKRQRANGQRDKAAAGIAT